MKLHTPDVLLKVSRNFQYNVALGKHTTKYITPIYCNSPTMPKAQSLVYEYDTVVYTSTSTLESTNMVVGSVYSAIVNGMY